MRCGCDWARYWLPSTDDVERLASSLLELSVVEKRSVDRDQLRVDLVGFAPLPRAALGEVNGRELASHLLALRRKHRLQLPGDSRTAEVLPDG